MSCAMIAGLRLEKAVPPEATPSSRMASRSAGIETGLGDQLRTSLMRWRFVGPVMFQRAGK